MWEIKYKSITIIYIGLFIYFFYYFFRPSIYISKIKRFLILFIQNLK